MSRKSVFQVELSGVLEGKTSVKSARGIVEQLLRNRFRQRETVLAKDVLAAAAEMTKRKFPFQKYWVDGKNPILGRTEIRGTYRNPFFKTPTSGSPKATAPAVVAVAPAAVVTAVAETPKVVG